MVENAHHWNQLHITTSGQQMLPRATAVKGNKQTSPKTNFEEFIQFVARTGANAAENARSHINCGKCTTTGTSGQQMLPRATAPMGNMMRPRANTDTTRLGTETRRTTRQNRKKMQDEKSKTSDQDKTKSNNIIITQDRSRDLRINIHAHQ